MSSESIKDIRDSERAGESCLLKIRSDRLGHPIKGNKGQDVKIKLTNFDCTECGEKSPYGLMRIPFKCKCNHRGNWSTLPKSIFEGNEYPESLKKFYSIFHQPERLRRVDAEKRSDSLNSTNE